MLLFLFLCLILIGVFIMDKLHEFIRKLDITTSNDNMEVHINIEYIPKFQQKDTNKSLAYTDEKVISMAPPVYSPDEIRYQLKKNNIIYGILQEALEKCSNINGVKNLLIAKGKEPVDGTDDTLEITFKKDSNRQFTEDSSGKINFKSIGSVEYVKSETVIARKHSGTDGSYGKNVYGHNIKYRPGNRIKLKAGIGCIVKDEKEVIALMDGKPSLIDNRFYVHEFHEINSDVDIKTGNIKFHGVIVVNGTVKEGMLVQSGASIEIKKDVEKSNIIAKGNIKVNGNVIFSKVVSGEETGIDIKNLDTFIDLKNNILDLIKVASQAKRFNRLKKNISYGEIIKLLIENRFKSIIRLCSEIVNIDEYTYSLFAKRLFNLSPLKLKAPRELLEIVTVIDNNIENIKKNVIIPTDINISYCQDSIIESSGNIIIEGKGEYVSKLRAKDSILFTRDDSISRGGLIKAGKEVRCGIVGSLSGVSTRISVERKGHIYVKKAYVNTVFSIGNLEYVVDVPCKEVHAYLNYNGEIIVDKLL